MATAGGERSLDCPWKEAPMQRPRPILSVLACLLLAVPAARAGGRVLLLAREHPDSVLIRKEVRPMIEQLRQAGFTVVVTSEHGTPISSGETLLQPDLPFARVDLAGFAGIVVPCMEGVTAPENFPIPAGYTRLLRAAGARKLPIAAQDLGVVALGMAGLLKGRAYAADGANSGFGGAFKGTGVVTDGNLVTSGACPVVSAQRGTRELITQFIRLLPAK